jgi:lipopolysaccharide heptosyltransferase II
MKRESRLPFPAKDAYLSFERKLDRYLGPPLILLLSLLSRRSVPATAPAEPRKILLVKLHGIGNIVLLLPALRQLRRRYPDAEIDFLSFRSNAGILEGTEELSQRHYLDRGSPRGLAGSMVRVFPRLRRRAYDLVIDFDQFAHFSSAIALWTGAPRRIGFRNPTLRRHLAYTTPVVYLDMAHVSRTFARLAEIAGAPPAPCISRGIPLTPEHLSEASEFLEEEGVPPGEELVVLHPGSSGNLTLRRWPAERFALLGDRIAGEFGCRIVVSGGREEVALAESVRSRMIHPAVNSAGKLSVRGFAALCGKARFVVSNDTAAVHIASAMGTPVVGLYGPNTPYLYGPLGGNDLVFHSELPCSPCLCNLTSKISDCRRARCMEEITVEMVFAGIRGRYFGSPGLHVRVRPGFLPSPGPAEKMLAGLRLP